MNDPHWDNESITDPPALLFRVTDRLRLDGSVKAMIMDGMSLALISRHEGTLDHYGKLLVQRLRAAAPEIALEVYFPASVEALLARFNDALRDSSVEDAMQGVVQNSVPRIWILHDAAALPAHEIELLARLIEYFPGANIRVMLLLTANSNKHQLLNPFGRRILRWEIEPPTPEQAELMLAQARSQGREGEALGLLQSAPAVQAAKDTAQTTPKTPLLTGGSGKNHWRLAIAAAALLIASTGAAFLLHTGTWTKATGLLAGVPVAGVPVAGVPVAVVPARMPARMPAEAAIASTGVATSVQTGVDERDALEEVITHSPQELQAIVWLQQLPSDAYLVQYTTEPSYQAAAQWVEKNSKLQNTQIIPIYLPGNSAIEFTVVSGPFSSSRKASKFVNDAASGKGAQIHTVNFLKEKSAVTTAPSVTPKRTKDPK